jgi:hypothetical protein
MAIKKLIILQKNEDIMKIAITKTEYVMHSNEIVSLDIISVNMFNNDRIRI